MHYKILNSYLNTLCKCRKKEISYFVVNRYNTWYHPLEIKLIKNDYNYYIILFANNHDSFLEQQNFL